MNRADDSNDRMVYTYSLSELFAHVSCWCVNLHNGDGESLNTKDDRAVEKDFSHPSPPPFCSAVCLVCSLVMRWPNRENLPKFGRTHWERKGKNGLFSCFHPFSFLFHSIFLSLSRSLSRFLAL